MRGSRARLGDVASIVRGVTFKPDDRRAPGSDGAIVCFRTANIQAELDTLDLIAVPHALVRQDQHVQEGDILVSSANSWNLVGRCVLVPRLEYMACAGGFISILRYKPDRVDAGYLFRWLSAPSVQAAVRNCANKTTSIANLSFPRFLELSLPLPSLAEQRRIAALLDRADAVRRKREESRRMVDELLRSVFLEMFGDPVRNEKGWEVAPIRSLMRLRSGDFLPASGMNQQGDCVVYGGNGPNGRHDSFLFAEPTIVIGRVGVYCGAVHLTAPKSWVTDNALAVHSLDPRLLVSFTAWSLRLLRLNRLANRAAQPLLTAGGIGEVGIPLPPLERQARFSQIAADIERQVSRAERAKDEAAALMATLSAQVLSAER